MTLTDLPVEEDLNAITEQVWSSLLGQELLVGPTEAPAADSVTAWIAISGPVPMVVTVTTAQVGAQALARCLLRIEHPSTDDVTDAIGELVNVLGGNVKSLLPGPSSLSLPVADRAPDLPAEARHHQDLQASFDGHAIRIDTWVVPAPEGHVP